MDPDPSSATDDLVAQGEFAAALELLTARAVDPGLGPEERGEARVDAAVMALRMYDLARVHDLVATAGHDLPEPYAAQLALIDLVLRSLLGDAGAADDLVEAISARLAGPLPGSELRLVAEALALAVARAGRRDDLLEVVLRASGMAFDLGASDLVTALGVAEAAYRSRSDLVGAAFAARRSVRTADETGDRRNLPFALAQLANALAGLGGAEVLAVADRLAGFGAASAVATADFARGMYALTLGDEDAAFPVFADLERRHGADPAVGVSWHADLVALALRAGDPELAAAAAASVRSLAELSGMPWLQAAALRARGLLAPDAADGVAALVEARSMFVARGYLIAAARTSLDLADRLGPASPERPEALARARDGFAGAGMTHWVRRVDDALAG